jgi:hypothetical protein
VTRCDASGRPSEPLAPWRPAVGDSAPAPRGASLTTRSGGPRRAMIASAAHRQALLVVQPVQVLAVHDRAFALEQDAEPAITEAASFEGERTQGHANRLVATRAKRRTVFAAIWTNLQARRGVGH